MRDPRLPTIVRTTDQLGIHLRRLRFESSLNLIQVYARTGIHPSTISGWESGKVSPSAKSLMRILPVYGVLFSTVAERG